jgi:hypothetical protein
MSRKRKINAGDSDSEPAIWKEDGEEQKLLEDLFKEGFIGEKDTSASVQNKDVSFSRFSSAVFGAHFRKTKKKMNINGKCNFDYI